MLHLDTLLTDFAVTGDGMIRVAYYTDYRQNEAEMTLRVIDARDDVVNAWLCKPGAQNQTGRYTSPSMLVTASGRLHRVYNSLYLFDYEAQEMCVARDIVNRPELNEFFQANTIRYAQTLPLRILTRTD